MTPGQIASDDDLRAGNTFRESLVPRADGLRDGAPVWFGWALMDAFLAGVEYARTHNIK